jgi:hypothetical protein
MSLESCTKSSGRSFQPMPQKVLIRQLRRGGGASSLPFPAMAPGWISRFSRRLDAASRYFRRPLGSHRTYQHCGRRVPRVSCGYRCSVDRPCVGRCFPCVAASYRSLLLQRGERLSAALVQPDGRRSGNWSAPCAQRTWEVVHLQYHSPYYRQNLLSRVERAQEPAFDGLILQRKPSRKAIEAREDWRHHRINTTKGLAYALYTHRHSAPPRFGDLIRVFAGLHERRPVPITAVVTDDILFTTFFPLGAAVNRDIVAVVGHMDVPDALKRFPIFRNGTPHPQTKRVKTWWLWDGSKEWRVGTLTPEQALYPLRGVWNDILLIERIEQRWRAHNDPIWRADPISCSQT